MSNRIPENQDVPAETSQGPAINTSRRKLAGTTLGIASVFTLSSRPVLAGVCLSPSGHQSGNLSHHGTAIKCSGRSPGYWKERPEKWPSPYSPGTCTGQYNNAENWSGGTLFHPLFAGDKFMANMGGHHAADKTSLSMMQVMHLNDGNNSWGLTDNANLGAHIVAALLNARAGLTPVLDETAVINMWREWATKGYYEPTAGVEWYAEKIVTYITSTFS